MSRREERLPSWIAILDLELCRQRGLAPAQLGRSLIEAGAPALRLRSTAAQSQQLAALARQLRPLAQRAGAALFIGHDAGLAAALDVDGLILAADAAAPTPAPRLVGVNLHAGQPIQAWARGADFAIISPFADPTSKPPSSPALGGRGFARLKREVGLPAYALGGATPELWPSMAAAGAIGPVVMGAVHCQEPATIVQQWERALRKG